MTQDLPRAPFVGHNIRRLRKLKDMSQQELGDKLGMSRQAIGILEQSQTVDEEKLGKVAAALGFTVEAIENFTEEQSVFQIEHMHDNAQAIYHYNANSYEKVVELYEALLKSEREKVAMLQGLLKSK